ncbi:class I SAM-dependent methyltransferase [Marinivivus vitaminiproducens]|uniref:class I SAM-dependent methyltransferase n=1 Tax=Marinivivus vitaminiproducens TaxID=3035935 RepID=UPI0027A08A52|nr:class I SAM-dependent methyltransferase [Geminicoccaceae bacterium SCSIO 64248]
MPTIDACLFRTEEEARSVARGTIALHGCRHCGLVWNAAFEEEKVLYDGTYEGGQTASPTFNRFHRALAADLVARCGLAGRRVLEIGCAQGEFLELVAEAGIGAIGFDPSYRAGPLPDGVTIHAQVYDGAPAPDDVGLIACKMTLEHIPETDRFLAGIRRGIGARGDVRAFLMIPEFDKIMAERRFWDLHYEHCVFFTPGALARAVRRAGLVPEDIWLGFGDQYVSILARPGAPERDLPLEEPARATVEKVDRFASGLAANVEAWRARFRAWREGGERVVLWGGGAKAVSFLSALGTDANVLGAVDINPMRQTTYLAGSAVPILAPGALGALAPDRVVVMSPIYLDEIRRMLADLGLHPVMVSVQDPDARR